LRVYPGKPFFISSSMKLSLIISRTFSRILIEKNLMVLDF